MHVDSKNTVPKQAMNGLETIIRNLDPDDPNVYAFAEAYAQFWLLDLEGDTPEDPRDTASRDAIKPILGALAEVSTVPEREWRLAV